MNSHLEEISQILHDMPLTLTNAEQASYLANAGLVLTSDDPKEFLDAEYPEISGRRLQALVNFLLTRQKEQETLAQHAESNKVFAYDDFVQVLHEGSWINGKVTEVTQWGHVEVATARGPVTVMPTGSRIRHQVAPVT